MCVCVCVCVCVCACVRVCVCEEKEQPAALLCSMRARAAGAPAAAADRPPSQQARTGCSQAGGWPRGGGACSQLLSCRGVCFALETAASSPECVGPSHTETCTTPRGKTVGLNRQPRSYHCGGGVHYTVVVVYTWSDSRVRTRRTRRACAPPRRWLTACALMNQAHTRAR